LEGEEWTLFGIWLDRYTFLVLWTTLLERLYFG